MIKKSIMIQGTASSVGKSFICAGLCRIFARKGYNVNPFKAQNMSLNSYITAEGGEIGRAQVNQAEAAFKLPHTSMNPILLKPCGEKKSQVILNGKVFKTMYASDYYSFKKELIPFVKDLYEKLLNNSDLVVIEGAGSPAEINLKENDIVNMGMAKIAGSPVILVADIDNGGVFASIYGTVMLLPPEERKYIKGIIINKFRGDVELLKSGIEKIEELTGICVLGVIPMFKVDIEEEDSQYDFKILENNKKSDLDIAVIKLPYMSNFTDINALKLEPNVYVYFAEKAADIKKPHVIIIPGTKSTVNAFQFLKETGIDKKIVELSSNGTFIFGICGGYQLLGKELKDPFNVEGGGNSKGLGLLNISTVFLKDKTTVLSKGKENMFGEYVKGYEIHMGEQKFLSESLRFIDLNGGFDGALSDNKKIAGTYFHGIFDNGIFTRKYINFVRKSFGINPYIGEINDYKQYKNSQYEKLADVIEQNIDMDKILRIMEDGI